MGLPEVCVVYLIRQTESGDEVLLGRKKTGLGLGKLVGPGGKLERGETPAQGAVREVLEEVGVVLDEVDLQPIGELTYPFPHKPEWSQKSWAFVCRIWSAAPVESDELKPEWHPVDAIPFSEMWDDAQYWLPQALNGMYVKATFAFAKDGSTVESTGWH